MEIASTVTHLAPGRTSTHDCDQDDAQPPPSKKAKLGDTRTSEGGRSWTCEGKDALSPSSKEPVISGTREQATCSNTTTCDSGAEAHRSSFDDDSMLPLSSADVAKFEEDGYVMLRGAFDAEVASACRDQLWRRLRGEGVMMQNSATWVKKKPIGETYGLPWSSKKKRGHPWKTALSPRLKAAVNQLLGADSWKQFGCGWWMVTFPGFAEAPWRADGTWHVDGAHFRHYPHSREVGLVPIFLLSDILPQGGGTALLRGSHKKIAEILWNQSGTTGLTGPELSSAARDVLLPADGKDVIETTGSAGDVMLTHPLLLHARSTNLAPVETRGVRFMCHPSVQLKRHFDFKADPDTFSPVQRVVWQSRPANGNGGCSAAPIVNPADCDHSAVKLSFGGGYKNRGRKKGKHSGKPSVECTKNVTGTVKTDEAECKTLPTDDSQAPEEASPPGVASRDAAEGGEEESEMQAIMGFSEFGACSQ